MAIDIAGWLEFKLTMEWLGVMNLRYILERDYTMFALLGRSHGIVSAIPLIDGRRGLPDDICSEMREHLAEDFDIYKTGGTWFLWDDIARFVDSSFTLPLTTFVTEIYRKRPTGNEFKGTSSSYPSRTTPEQNKQLLTEGETENEKYYYKLRTQQEQHKLEEGWIRAFEVAKDLSRRYGERRVRFSIYYE